MGIAETAITRDFRRLFLRDGDVGGYLAPRDVTIVKQRGLASVQLSLIG